MLQRLKKRRELTVALTSIHTTTENDSSYYQRTEQWPFREGSFLCLNKAKMPPCSLSRWGTLFIVIQHRYFNETLCLVRDFPRSSFPRERHRPSARWQMPSQLIYGHSLAFNICRGTFPRAFPVCFRNCDCGINKTSAIEVRRSSVVQKEKKSR